jgi:hypothetical protein
MIVGHIVWFSAALMALIVAGLVQSLGWHLNTRQPWTAAAFSFSHDLSIAGALVCLPPIHRPPSTSKNTR